MLRLIRRWIFSIIKYLFSRGLFLVVVFALFGSVVGFAYNLGNFLKTPLNMTEEVRLEIPSGTSLASLTQKLTNQAGLHDERYFQIYSRLTGQSGKLKAGEYLLKPGMTAQDILSLVTSGQSIQYSFTLIEGWTFKQLIAELKKDPDITFTLEGLSPDEIMTALGLDGAHYEGYFLPDTYFFPKGYEDRALLKRSYTAMQRVAEDAWRRKDGDLPIKSLHELLTLASIIEKETGVAFERPEIAGVFVRRLNLNMKLQTDPTVIYGLGDNYRGDIYLSDLKRDTPYNTYTRAGLPPGPIAMPSRAAIYAAANPATGKSLYFVAKGDGSGEHVFSNTLDEHNRAVQAYRKAIKKQ